MFEYQVMKHLSNHPDGCTIANIKKALSSYQTRFVYESGYQYRTFYLKKYLRRWIGRGIKIVTVDECRLYFYDEINTSRMIQYEVSLLNIDDHFSGAIDEDALDDE